MNITYPISYSSLLRNTKAFHDWSHKSKCTWFKSYFKMHINMCWFRKISCGFVFLFGFWLIVRKFDLISEIIRIDRLTTKTIFSTNYCIRLGVRFSNLRLLKGSLMTLIFRKKTSICMFLAKPPKDMLTMEKVFMQLSNTHKWKSNTREKYECSTLWERVACHWIAHHQTLHGHRIILQLSGDSIQCQTTFFFPKVD